MTNGVRDLARLRAWLEYVAQTAIDWLDRLDAPTEDLEDDEVEHLGVLTPPHTSLASTPEETGHEPLPRH